MASIAAVSAIAAFALYMIPIQAHTPSSVGSEGERAPLSRDPVMKTFIIGYQMAIPSENMNKVSSSDFPWLDDMMQYGEALVSTEQAEEFLKSSNEISDYEIVTVDGKTAYYNIEVYQIDMIPNTPYVKAYWHYGLPDGKESVQLGVEENTSLKSAIMRSSSWVPLETSDDARNVEQLLDSSSKYISAANDEGIVQFYELRYIDALQERVS